MQLTKSHLKQIIKKELRTLMQEQFWIGGSRRPKKDELDPRQLQDPQQRRECWLYKGKERGMSRIGYAHGSSVMGWRWPRRSCGQQACPEGATKSMRYLPGEEMRRNAPKKLYFWSNGKWNPCESKRCEGGYRAYITKRNECKALIQRAIADSPEGKRKAARLAAAEKAAAQKAAAEKTAATEKAAAMKGAATEKAAAKKGGGKHTRDMSSCMEKMLMDAPSSIGGGRKQYQQALAYCQNWVKFGQYNK